ncbi:MAG: NBR1-Ig-like domain-containing protein [Chloroflexota bacterium]
MRFKYIKLINLFILLGLVVTACNLPGYSRTPTPGPNLAQTIAAQTVEARLTEIAASSGGPPPPTTQAPQVPPTNTLPPMLPTFTNSPMPTNTPTITSTPICDRVAFVADITIPDDTEMSPGQAFTKTWRLRNTGECTWNSAYRVVFSGGEAMGAPASVQLTSGTIGPGQTVDVSVDMVAPNAPGTYQGFWKLRNPAGMVFGLGASGEVAFWVKIKVKAGPSFDMSYHNTHLCGGLTYATFRIVDNGSEYFESAEIYIKDLNDNTDIYGPLFNNTPFLTSPNDCPPANSDTEPRNVPYYIAVSIAGSTSGHTARCRIKLCTEDALGGDCVTKSVDFTIP